MNWLWFILALAVVVVVGLLESSGWVGRTAKQLGLFPDAKKTRGNTAADASGSSKHKSGSFQYKLGQDSGWVLLYQIAGWLGLIGGLIWILGNSNWANGVYSVLVASSAFFAAHVLRLMEKTAHNSEQQTELLQKLVEKR